MKKFISFFLAIAIVGGRSPLFPLENRETSAEICLFQDGYISASDVYVGETIKEQECASLVKRMKPDALGATLFARNCYAAYGRDVVGTSYRHCFFEFLGLEYTKVAKKHCFSDKYNVYNTVAEAKKDCNEDSGCQAVYDNGCNEKLKGVHLCKMGTTYSDSKSSCVYEKAMNWGMKQWMGKLGDDELLSELSIPGTHDTMTGNKQSDNDCKDFIYQTCCVCQDMTLEEQLHAGIRFVDIRLRHHDNDFTLHHGFISLGVKLKTVLKVLTDFLKANPTETVIMSYQKEHTEENNKGVSFHTDFQRHIATVNKDYIYSVNSMPHLREVRGKIVLLDWSYDGHVGLRRNNKLVENWWDNIMSRKPRSMWKVNKEYYTKLESNIASSQMRDSPYAPSRFYSSWFSANECMKTMGIYGPRKIANIVNKEMYGRLEKRRTQGNYGVIVMDFPSDYLIKTIIAENF